MPKTLHSSGHTALIEALIEARNSIGLSQATLAQRLGCHQSLVARIESGQRRIDVPELVILARALETDPKQFIDQIEASIPDDTKI